MNQNKTIIKCILTKRSETNTMFTLSLTQYCDFDNIVM